MPAKKNAISTAAVSAASEPCTALASMLAAKSARIVPRSAFFGSVAPISSRFLAIAPSPSSSGILGKAFDCRGPSPVATGSATAPAAAVAATTAAATTAITAAPAAVATATAAATSVLAMEGVGADVADRGLKRVGLLGVALGA